MGTEMSRDVPVVASCGLVQVVHLTWGKSARGGEGARLRNAVPLAFSFPLAQTAEGGERLELTIVDVDRAGEYEPWRGGTLQDTRIVREIYPPRMTLKFRHFDASGALVSEGERKLSDPAFLLGTTPINNSDPLRYEKRMIDSWLRRELDTAAR